MNLPPPQPNDAESRITAYLLGQLPPKEQKAVEIQIAADLELAALAYRLKKTIGLLQQAVPSTTSSPESSGDWRFPSERRKALLAKLSAQALTTASQPQSQIPWYVPLGIAACLVFVVLPALYLPSLVKAKSAAIKYARQGESGLARRLMELKNERGIQRKSESSSQSLQRANTDATGQTQTGVADFDTMRRGGISEIQLPASQAIVQSGVSREPQWMDGAGEEEAVSNDSITAGAPVSAMDFYAGLNPDGEASDSLDTARFGIALPETPAAETSAALAASQPNTASPKAGPFSRESRPLAAQPSAAPVDANLADKMQLGLRAAKRPDATGPERSSQPTPEHPSRHYFFRVPAPPAIKSAPPPEDSKAKAAATSAKQALTQDKDLRVLNESLLQTERQKPESRSRRLRGRAAETAEVLGELADFEEKSPTAEDAVSGGESTRQQFGEPTERFAGVFFDDRFRQEDQQTSRPADETTPSKPVPLSQLSAARPRLALRGEAQSSNRAWGAYGGRPQTNNGIGGGGIAGTAGSIRHLPKENAALSKQLYTWNFESVDDLETETDALANVMAKAVSNNTTGNQSATKRDAYSLLNGAPSDGNDFGFSSAPARERLSRLAIEAEFAEHEALGLAPRRDAAALSILADDQTRAFGSTEALFDELAAVPKGLADRVAGQKEVLSRKQSLAESKALREVEQREKALSQIALMEAEEEEIRQVERTLERRPAEELFFNREQSTRVNPISTFSLNVSDVSFHLAAASLNAGALPDPANIRPEEFFNAFAYYDPLPRSAAPIAVRTEQARFPFGHGQDILRISVRTQSTGRSRQTPLNLVVLLDRSGSMERPDRQAIVRQALESLASSLQDSDRISLVAFARESRLWADGLPGSEARQALEQLSKLIPEGGTNLETALDTAYMTAKKHFFPQGLNRVILMTDGAANLGNTDTAALRSQVESHRRAGIALDCFGIGWDGYDDQRLEALTRNGDGRYAFLNNAAQVEADFRRQLTGALNVAARNVKVQITFRAERVTGYRQIGYAKHQLKKEDFRDNTVDAAEMSAAETGTALYLLAIDREGTGPIGDLSIRFQNPKTNEYRELSWSIPYREDATELEAASAAMQLAAAAGAFAEWLAGVPYSQGIDLDAIKQLLAQARSAYPLDPDIRQLENMIFQAQSLTRG